VLVETTRWYTRQLHFSATGYSTTRQANVGACQTHRLSVYLHLAVAVSRTLTVSASRRSFRRTRNRIHAVRVQVDELLVDEGNQYEMYSTDVGYVSCESS
jgi:hypothetical protein